MILATALTAALAAPLTAAEHHVLDNGLTVVIEPQTRTDEVALYLKYRVGSRDEGPGTYGAAHLFEHLMFEGSAHVDTNMFDTWLTAAGGWNNAWTSLDETVYHEVFPSGALDLALFLESDRMGFLEAGLTADNLANQQAVVLQERAQGYAAPHGRTNDAVMRRLFPPGHPYHVPVIGTVADIEGLSLEAVQAFFQAHYRPSNAVLVIVGKVDPAEALERVSHWFSDVSSEAVASERPQGDPRPPPGVPGKIEDAVQDRSLVIAWPTVPIGHDDTYALEVLSWLLDGGRGTRMADALYHRRNLTTDMGVYTHHAEVAGMFEVHATSAGLPLRRIDAIATRILRKVARRPPKDDEVARAVRTLVAQVHDRLERPTGRAEILLGCTVHMGAPNCIDAEIARYRAVTPEDVQRVAATWLKPDARTVLSVLPPGDDGALGEATLVELP